MSGIVVAIVALPLSIALAIASCVGPEQGLYTAIVAGFLIAFLGGSRVQISGPTAAFATIVAGIVATDGIDGLVAATLIAGVLLALMGLLKLGTIIRFVPHTITTGFTAAIAVGMFITVVLFMKMVSEETEAKGWKYYCDADSEVTHLRELPKSVRVYEINGPMFFGMTDRITDISVKEFTKYLIIRMRGVPSLDSSGMNALENLYDYCKENGVKLIFSHANEQPVKTMRRAGFVDLVGEEHFRPNIDDAIEHARELIAAEEAAKSAKAA